MDLSNKFIPQYEKLKEWGLTKKEQNILKVLFASLTKEEKEKVLAKYDNLKNEPENSFFKSLRESLKILKNEVEVSQNIDWFDSLKETFEENEVMQSLLNSFWRYIDIKLNKDFNKSEKNTIKLALFWEIQKSLNLNWVLKVAIVKVWEFAESIISSFNKNSKKDWDLSLPTEKKLTKIKKQFDDSFSEFWISNITDIIDEKVNKLNEDKIKNGSSFNNINSIFNITNKNNIWNITKDSILKDTKELAKTLKSWKELWNDLTEALSSIPFWSKIISWIEKIIKDWWFFGFILWLIFWKNFEKNVDSWKSVNNLKDFAKDDKFPLKDNIKKEELEELKPEKLKKFYKFLDWVEWIDCTSNTFWQELLTWKSKNPKIKELYELIINKDWKILDKNDWLKELLNKLNWIEESINKKEKEKSVKAKTEAKTAKAEAERLKIEAEKATAKAKTAEAKAEAERLKIEAKKAEAEAERLKIEAEKAKTFEELLLEWKIKIWDKIENISIDSQNHILTIWNNSYKISILWTIWWITNNNYLEKVSFKNWKIIIKANWKTLEYSATEFKPSLKKLIYKWWIEKDIEWEFAKLTIRKI